MLHACQSCDRTEAVSKQGSLSVEKGRRHTKRPKGHEREWENLGPMGEMGSGPSWELSWYLMHARCGHCLSIISPIFLRVSFQSKSITKTEPIDWMRHNAWAQRVLLVFVNWQSQSRNEKCMFNNKDFQSILWNQLSSHLPYLGRWEDGVVKEGFLEEVMPGLHHKPLVGGWGSQKNSDRRDSKRICPKSRNSLGYTQKSRPACWATKG